jgi:hypothetical protein
MTYLALEIKRALRSPVRATSLEKAWSAWSWRCRPWCLCR